MKVDSAAQRSTLILQLGRVLAPVDALAEKAQPPTNTEYQIVAASLGPDMDRWMNEVCVFVTFGTARFVDEYNEIAGEQYGLRNYLGILARKSSDPFDKQKEFRERVALVKKNTLNAIDRVPINWAAELHEANTPFTVYLKIRDAINTAKRCVHYFDRYLDSDFFHLYLRDLSRTLELRLVTTKGKATFGVANVLPLSRVAGEFRNYQLIECQPCHLHDRNSAC
ncbi:MAG: hypothetical protein R3C20_04720 [Planctomycetaceae bacterium]